MNHDVDASAAAYLAGDMTSEDRERFEAHLVECDECWKEVDTARRGLVAATDAREFAPAHLRERIRELPQIERPRHPPRRVYRWVAAAVVAAVVGAGAFVVSQRDSEHAVIAAAVAGYNERELPGSSMPKTPVPDLSAVDLVEVGAGHGRIESLDVDAFVYRDQAGRSVMIYTAKEAFPMPDGARPLRSGRGPWVAEERGVTVLCARYPHELLIIGKDGDLVRDVADTMRVA